LYLGVRLWRQTAAEEEEEEEENLLT